MSFQISPMAMMIQAMGDGALDELIASPFYPGDILPTDSMRLARMLTWVASQASLSPAARVRRAYRDKEAGATGATAITSAYAALLDPEELSALKAAVATQSPENDQLLVATDRKVGDRLATVLSELSSDFTNTVMAGMGKNAVTTGRPAIPRPAVTNHNDRKYQPRKNGEW